MGKKNHFKHDIQTVLNVSPATINNWIKTGLIPRPYKNGFSEDEFAKIINDFTSSDSSKLKGRANRSLVKNNYICYLGITEKEIKLQLNKAVEFYKNLSFSIDESIFSISVASLNSSGLLNYNWFHHPKTKIEFFLLEWAEQKQFNIENVIKLYQGFSFPNNDDDFIGAFYQSVQSVSSKSKIGSYYTPAILMEDIQIPLGKTVLDPCCGSGGIFLKVLDKKHQSNQIFAWDIDDTALKICRINLCLFFNDPNAAPNIEKHDLIFGENINLFKLGNNYKFDYIITNPPWGSKFSSSDKEVLLKKYPFLSTTESFSIILYNSMQQLAENGSLIFFLPHSFLNVSTHNSIRKYLVKQKIPLKIKLLGNSFRGVMSEAIRLEISKKTMPENIQVITNYSQKTLSISFDSLREPDYIIPATASNRDFDLINKVYNKEHLLLKNNAKFALGVVTGNNGKHLLTKPSANTEPIFRGKDICRFRFCQPVFHIEFNPTIYQQVAPVVLYRQQKITYRFISDRIVCALDSKDRLLLNSANLFIPTLSYPLETIVTLFNSKLYTYIYKKMFHSKKVLKGHLESLPLPLLNAEEHSRLKSLHDRFIINEVNHNEKAAYNDLNKFVYSLFCLSNEEADIIETDIMI